MIRAAAIACVLTLAACQSTPQFDSSAQSRMPKPIAISTLNEIYDGACRFDDRGAVYGLNTPASRTSGGSRRGEFTQILQYPDIRWAVYSEGDGRRKVQVRAGNIWIMHIACTKSVSVSEARNLTTAFAALGVKQCSKAMCN